MKKILKRLLKKKEPTLTIGILALQGNFKEHADTLSRLGANTVLVKLPIDLKKIDGLIIPGGESTTLRKLMYQYLLDKEIIKRSKQGMPIFGTCAGAILLSKEIIGEHSPTLHLIDLSIERNAYGRQAESFEADIEIKDMGTFKGIFIRSPVIEKTHNCVVLASYRHKPILARQGNILVSTFHPELTEGTKIHQYFLKMVEESQELRQMHQYLES